MRNVARRTIYASSPAEVPQNKKRQLSIKKKQSSLKTKQKNSNQLQQKTPTQKKEGQHLTRADKTIVLQVRYD
jgi:hypothetical protein